MKLWRDTRQAIKGIFSKEYAARIRCYAIVPGDPSAVVVQSPNWRLRITSDDLEVVRGQIDPDHLNRIMRALASHYSIASSPDNGNNSVHDLDDDLPGIN